MNNKIFTAFEHVYRFDKKNKVKYWYLLLLAFILLLIFLPWTQNIRAKGKITALRQEHRPQQINTIIGGRVEKWFVKEGDYVRKGDTIVQLSEVKTDYLDPQLLQRTQEQLQAKESSVNYYKGKIQATETQISALQNGLQAKLSQLRSKLQQTQIKMQSDSMDMVAATNELQIASLQFNRQKNLYDSGLVSLTQLEQRNQAYQNSNAKKISAENKFFATKQELEIIRIDFNATQQDYLEKTAKAQSDKLGALSEVASGEGDIAKLQNMYAGYAIRNNMYYVIAPQNGQVVQAKTTGIGEVVKEGEMLVHIVPGNAEYAVEMYVRPVDLPLVSVGQPVRFLFDGFPAIVFSGWPAASYGVYAGTVSAVESDVSDNGMFRVIVKEDAAYRPWPTSLKMGTGASAIALLKNVPLWYELWRNINSFPPDYYVHEKKKEGKE